MPEEQVPTRTASQPSVNQPTSPPAAAAAAPTAMQLIPNPTYLAITESISYYTYRQQNWTLALLSLPPVPWESLVPRPSVSLEEAAKHVEGVRKFCGVTEDGVVVQPGQGEGGTVVDIEEEGRRVLEMLKKDEEVTGTASILVEFDGHPYKLVLPQLDELSKEQRIALALHARHARIIDALRAHLKDMELYIPPPPPPPAVSHPLPAPTPTYQPPAPPTHLRLRTIARLLPRFIGAAIKIEIALWMITRSLRSSDGRYWLFIAGAIGWWVWQCRGIYRGEGARMRVVREREERERGGAGRHGPAVPVQAEQVNREQRQPAAARRDRRRNNNSSRPNPLPFLGLAYERRLLRLFYLAPSTNAVTQTTDRRIPSTDLNLPLAPSDPSFLWTYLFIPIYLCLLSLWPDWDHARKTAIREREAHMRLLSVKLSEAAAEAAADANARRAQAQDRETDQNTSADNLPSSHHPTQPTQPQPTPTSAATAAPEAVIPRNLSAASERYWRRVLARGETIDWDEERAAQERVLRAAGQGGAEEQQGMGFL
ncbi:hypothetical protein QFC21_002001 [Naganishia friedmannii]|uniref:Uncharacterized protein n=1 Tax=Naganishia friedmannii TaxID=89922 RepID=A0ACC2W059_9TREE|nr:hypothetical protein QFC21_002001 [Naganishia friedmannii]